ncbi:MAG: LysE family translocator [Acetobacteraceae bacterium]
MLHAGEAAWIASVIAFATAMAATPGPNNTMVTASGANFGFRRTVPHMLGIAAGFPVMLVALALGAGAPLQAWPWLHQALQGIGVLYLLWLAWRIATSRPNAAGPGGARRSPMTFLQAALFQWVNPKAWIVAAGAVVTYTAQGSALLTQVAVLAALFAIVTLPAVAFWTSVGVGAARLLRSERALRLFNLAMAGLLLLSLLPLVREVLG